MCIALQKHLAHTQPPARPCAPPAIRKEEEKVGHEQNETPCTIWRGARRPINAGLQHTASHSASRLMMESSSSIVHFHNPEACWLDVRESLDQSSSKLTKSEFGALLPAFIASCV